MEEAWSPEPVDPDVDLRVPAQRDELRRGHGSVLAVVAIGGALGAGARYGASQMWPSAVSDAFPWATLGVNAVGCALIGVLMAALTEIGPAHRLVRPLLGTGFLGGFTTFSAYAGDIHALIDAGRPRTAAAYLAATLLLALAAVAGAAWGTRRVLARRRRLNGPDTAGESG